MKLRILLLLVFLLVLLVASVHFVPRLIKINEITCQNQYGQCSLIIQQELGNVSGVDLLQSRRSIKQLLSNNFLIKDYSISFKLPVTYEVHLIEKKPRFALGEKRESQVALIDREGQTISIVDSTNLPRVFVSEKIPNLGESIEKGTLFALNLMFDVYSSYQVQDGTLENNSLLIELTGGTKVLFPLEGDRQVLLGSLNIILNQLNSSEKGSTIEDVDISRKTIDLRFNNPVIR